MARTSPHFRADHVGSLLRPARLLQAREDLAAGRIEAGELRAIEEEAITAAVAMQKDIGLQSATDGESRRALWHMDSSTSWAASGRHPGMSSLKKRAGVKVE